MNPAEALASQQDSSAQLAVSVFMVALVVIVVAIRIINTKFRR